MAISQETSKNFPFSEFVDDPHKIIAEFMLEDTLSISKDTGSKMNIKKQGVMAKKTKELADLEDFLSGRSKDPEKIKNIVRNGDFPLDSPVRPVLWSRLTNLISKPFSRDEIYLAALKIVYGDEAKTSHVNIMTDSMPPFAEERFHESRYLSPRGVNALRRVVMVVSYERPDITYCPCLYSFAAILLHYMTEEECYECATAVLQQKTPLQYLTQTKRSYHVLSYIFQMMSKKYCRSAYNFLESNNRDVDEIFEDWTFWIFNHLPFYHVVRTIDCYLCEGPKVLYRVGMAILDLYHKNCMSEGSRSSLNLATIQEFCSNMKLSPSQLFKVAFAYKDLSKTIIKKIELKAEPLSLQPKQKKINVRSNSVEFLVPTETKSRLMTRNELLDVASEGPRHRCYSQSTEYSHSFANVVSEIINRKHWKSIYNWLPPRIALLKPYLLFSTSDDGCSLKTFYNKVETQEQTLLVIFTSYGDLLGCYVSGKWLDRRHTSGSKYFGTGESFVFKLLPEPAQMYGWVGLESDKGSEKDVREEDSEAKRRMHRTALYATGDDTMLSIGGGSQGQALYIYDDISKVSSNPSDTFTNPCLLTRGDVHPISIMEAFGFVA